MKTVKFDIGIVGSSGFIADKLIGQLRTKQLNFCSLGSSQAKSSQNHYIIDLKKDSLPQFLVENRIELKTLIFLSAKKGRFENGSDEWVTQGNITAPDFLIDGAVSKSFGRLITIGSSEEYGPKSDPAPILECEKLNPVSSYGYWKSQLYNNGLAWQNTTGCPFIHLRPFNVIGSGADKTMFVNSLITALTEGQEFNMTLGEQHRSFVSVATLVKAIVKLLDSDDWSAYHRCHAMNISEPHYFQLKAVAEVIASKMNSKKINFGKLPYRKDEVWHQKPDLALIERLLGPGYYHEFTSTIDEMIPTKAAK